MNIIGFEPDAALSQEDVDAFCGPCDYRTTCGRKDEDRSLGGKTDQQRYAARGWCGWAVVDGKRGDMTPRGFKTKE